MDMELLLSSDNSELKHVVTVNAEIFAYAHENLAFQELLKRTINTIDGRVIWQMCSVLYPGRPVRKMSGSDFIYNLASHAARHGERMFLLGADPEANKGALEALRAKHSNLDVVGYSPVFSADIKDQKWNEEILGRIADFRPTHLVVCFGPVKQEMWIAQNSDLLFRMGVRCAYGLGGTLDFVSGRKKRAPRWTQRVGVEWLYRLFTESGRVGRTAKMFKMPYFAFRYFGHECEFIPGPKQSGPVDLRQS
jgi:N-acetylglucosaminyldiphosphoundecaprenol N-acetyl-beta-D-mannosaminyltransferase